MHVGLLSGQVFSLFGELWLAGSHEGGGICTGRRSRAKCGEVGVHWESGAAALLKAVWWDIRLASLLTHLYDFFRPTSLPSSILIHPAIWPQQIWTENWGDGLCPFGEGELGPYVTQCGRGRGLPPCQVASWSIQPFGHNTSMLQTVQTDRTDTQFIQTYILQIII